jgi:threonyl-tRNA synthetase
MPERLDASFIGEDGNRHTPVMLHRAILGSFERFIGILIENYAGDFPFWLAPEQIRILPVSDEARVFAETVQINLLESGVLSTLDSSGERLGKLIRNGEQAKIPVLAIIGSKEVQNNTVSLRSRRSGDLGEMSIDKLIDCCSRANLNKSLDIATEQPHK